MNYWLLKSEPDVWSIDQQKKSGLKGAPWDGVRNYQAAKNLKNMRKGDLCFFYHSNQKPPAIVGIMEVCSDAYPDALQFDPESKYFDEKSSEAEPRWINVEMRFVEKFAHPITRDQLKEKNELASMELFRLGRYSITLVSKEEWETILTLKNGS